MSNNLTHLQTQIAAHDVFGQFRFITTDDGEIYFVAIDVCKILGIKNVTRALSSLQEDEKIKIDEKLLINFDPNFYEGSAVTPFMHEINFVNEPGLYRLIFKSRKKSAKDFQHWVYHEVLPSIRKTGSYSVVKQPARLEDNFDKFEPLLKEYFKKNPNADFDIVGASVVQGNDGLPILSLKIGLVED